MTTRTPIFDEAAAFTELDDWPTLTAEEDDSSLGADDNWPHTKRVMPWMVAGFLVMVFLVPFEAIIPKVHLPANGTPDRLFLVLMIVVLMVTARARRSGPRRRMTAVECAVLVFLAVALLSVVLNIDRIYQENQLSFVEKGLAQLLAYVAFFFIVVATVRPAEMKAIGRLILSLTCLTALGTIYEAHTGYNVFYLWSTKLLSHIASVAPSPTDIHPLYGRATIVGPTQHGLALASMMTIALPFAVLPLLEAKRIRDRLMYVGAIGLILAACLSTHEKTAMLAPIGAFAVLIAYKRQLLRFLPLAVIALVPVIHFASPGALGGLQALNPFGSTADYSDGRTSDYAAVAPDILSHPLIGRGYATLDPQNWLWYRILDNQYLDELFVVGILGLVAYLAIILTSIGTAHRVIRAGGLRAPPVLAASAGCVAFGLVSATFDAMGYPQAIYSFLFLAGLIAVAAKDRAAESQRAPGPRRERPRGPRPGAVRRRRPSTGAAALDELLSRTGPR
jgi:O-antigen ligase